MVKVFNSIKEIEREYKAIYFSMNNKNLCLKYEWMLIQEHEYRNNCGLYLIYRIFYICFYDENQIIAVFPIQIGRFNHSASLLGTKGPYDFFGLVYSELFTLVEFKELIEFIFHWFHIKSLSMNRIHDECLVKFLSGCSLHIVDTISSCYSIPVKDSYELYYQELGKSTKKERNNLYNRLVKTGKSIDLEIFINQVLPEDLIQRIESVHKKRAKEKNPLNKLKQNIWKLKWLISKPVSMNIYSRLYRNEKMTAFIFRIDSEIAAYCIGCMTPNGSGIFQATEVSIDSKYSEYSPGIQLFFLIIKAIHEKDLPITSIDLTRGSELYKIKCGGQEYFNHNYLITKL